MAVQSCSWLQGADLSKEHLLPPAHPIPSVPAKGQGSCPHRVKCVPVTQEERKPTVTGDLWKPLPLTGWCYRLQERLSQELAVLRHHLCVLAVLTRAWSWISGGRQLGLEARGLAGLGLLRGDTALGTSSGGHGTCRGCPGRAVPWHCPTPCSQPASGQGSAGIQAGSSPHKGTANLRASPHGYSCSCVKIAGVSAAPRAQGARRDPSLALCFQPRSPTSPPAAPGHKALESTRHLLCRTVIYQPYGDLSADLSALRSSLMKHNLIASLTNTELLPEQGTTSTNKQTNCCYLQGKS